MFSRKGRNALTAAHSLSSPDEQLGGAVPPRQHVRRQVFLVGLCDLARQAEVDDLDHALVRHHHVGRLEVTVDDLMAATAAKNNQ